MTKQNDFCKIGLEASPVRQAVDENHKRMWLLHLCLSTFLTIHMYTILVSLCTNLQC